MSMAVVEIAGKQYLVEPGNVIQTERLKGAEGDSVTFDRVLFFWDGKEAKLGRPHLEGFKVEGKLLGEKKGPKVISYKFKRRKDSHRKVGHRQWVSSVEVDGISGPGTAKAKAKPKAARPAKPKTAGPKTGESAKPESARKAGTKKKAVKAEPKKTAAKAKKDTK